ncbi:sulfotransferase domain-containing protein [Salinibacter ruber]|uniref:sulfotransferase domain-containing protein n=1 Tax=Salinibacter ruber TaxID=146919 RepID=UPI0016171380|nr:sulfotransferase domain-containing protein [Salinibacter ruber]MBB4062407.1 hypothetical protein [Salinibacter ruber]
MLPDFLNLGVARCGTSWLHNLLDSHPNVYVPKRRKEVHFFCNHYEKGLEWYKGFFPQKEYEDRYHAVGEVAVHYLMDHNKSAKRIADVGSVERIMVMVRDPVERAWSHYHWKTGVNESSKTLREKAKEVPMIINSGLYATGLRTYENYFDRSNILILKSEESFQNVDKTKKRVANFLNVDEEKFPEDAGKERVNEQAAPRFGWLSEMASLLSYKLRMRDLDWISNAVKRTGLKRVLMKQEEKEKEEISQKDFRWLVSQYEEEVRELEKSFGVDTSDWRDSWHERIS